MGQLCGVQLEECNDLQSINLKAIGMDTLSLGTCPNLISLRLSAPVLRNLDLKCAHTLDITLRVHTGSSF